MKYTKKEILDIMWHQDSFYLFDELENNWRFTIEIDGVSYDSESIIDSDDLPEDKEGDIDWEFFFAGEYVQGVAEEFATRLNSSRRISVNNGWSFIDAAEFYQLPEKERPGWETVVSYMDDEAREVIHNIWGDEEHPFGDTDEIHEKFLRAYLEIAPEDIVIG